MIDTIRKQLGERASLLDYKATGVAASMLHLPGPDFVDRVFVPSDRPSAVLRNLSWMFGTGRLANTGYLSILPVDQGIEHSGAASFSPNPEYFDPVNIVKLAHEGGCNAVASTLGVLGAVAREYAHRIPFIVKLNHNELLTYPATYDETVFASVKQAFEMGAVGVGATIKSMLEHKLNPNDVLEAFKNHPTVAPLVRDGEQKEYSAHLIPDGGYKKLSKMSGDHVMVVGDAAGFVNATLFHEGTNLAMETGKLAGETAVEAFKKKDYSAVSLSLFDTKIKNSFPMKDLKQFKNTGETLEHSPKMFEKYPVLFGDLVSELFTVDGEPKWNKEKRLIGKLLTSENPFSLLKTMMDMRRVII